MFEIGAGIVLMLSLKFFVQPALALMIARLLSLPTEQVRYVPLIGAMPCGFFGVVFGKSFGSSPNWQALPSSHSCLACIPILAAWIAVGIHLM